LTGIAARFDANTGAIGSESADRPTFAHFCAGLLRMLEKQMIEGRALNLKRLGFARVAAITEDEVK
jgi:hypothetical protein